MFTRQRYVAGDLTGQSRAERGERFYLFEHLTRSPSLSPSPLPSSLLSLLAKTALPPSCFLSLLLPSPLFLSSLYPSDRGSFGGVGSLIDRVNVV